MGRKPITYGHNRHRTRTQLATEPTSSPLLDITDPDEKLTRAEMTRRMLKRSRHSGSCSAGASLLDGLSDASYSTKKPKLSLHEELQSGQDLGHATFLRSSAYDLQTPHPTLLTEAQIFKLESSRGRPLPSDYEFSPVPLAPKHGFSPLSNGRTALSQARASRKKDFSRRTSSRSLKENVTAPSSRPSSHSRRQHTKASRPVTRSNSKTTAARLPLASPFTSHPSSPRLSPKPKTKSKYNAFKPITRPTTIKRTLSDTHFNPNLPVAKTQTQSTANSPVCQVADSEFPKTRRPSAPSAIAQRPNVASWFIPSASSNMKPHLENASSCSPSIFDLTAPVDCGVGVDFNRPPSQLSYTSAYDEGFFGDAFGVSTPFGLRAQSKDYYRCAESPDFTDDEADGWIPSCHASVRVPLHSNMHPRLESRTHDTLSPALRRRIERSGSPWLSDSIISPPSITQKRAYSLHSSPSALQDEDIEMKLDAQDDRDDVDSLGLGPELTSLSGNIGIPKDRGQGDYREALQELFHSLDLGFGDGASRASISRTRSLDIEPERSQLQEQTQGNALQSPAHISPSKTKHVDTETTTKEKRGGRDRRGTIRASDFQAQVVAGARRTRSGTVVQGPTRPRRERSGTIIATSQAQGALVAKTSAARPEEHEDVDMHGPQGHDGYLDDVHMSGEVDEDELNLVGYWHDEDWVVAEPPSPEVPRRKPKRAPGWKKSWGIGRGLGTWGMAEHDEDDGGDDPLLLR
ncbi:hypothetical protein Hypma_003647 [Hypsizygus marmoreus]|uniref:Uncharacterized protein n=1 Tax=Hypsizygus marmoreus TaxID=39966 RepID=A0A369J7W1_HYPMA|nr:hypothetical protein Hypma_003647 [Hypsizygus marmoreus]